MNVPVSVGFKAAMMAVSLLLSFVLWVAVQLMTPAAQKTTSVDAYPINDKKYENKYIFPPLDQVQVQIEGPQDQLANATPADLAKIAREEDLYVYVDFNDAHPGTAYYPIRLSYHRDQPFTFTPVQSSMKVTIMEMGTRRIPVTVEPTGQIPSSLNLTYDGGTPDPATVVVKGPASAVDQVKKVRVLLDLSQVTPHSSIVVPPDPIDDHDQVVSGLDIEPRGINVTPSLAPAPETQTVTVNAIMNGHPALGYVVTDYAVEPSQVAVQGPPDVLAKMRTVSTRAISLEGLRASASFEVPLELPQDVRLYSARDVRVRVTIEPQGGSSQATQQIP